MQTALSRGRERQERQARPNTTTHSDESTDRTKPEPSAVLASKEPTLTADSSFLKLVRDLGQEVRELVRQEITLAKTEVSEKIQYFGRNSVLVGIGAVIGYAGLIVLLLGLGFLAAWVIHLAGIQGLFASFLGLFGVGLVVIGISGGLLLKGIKALRTESLAPDRTLVTLKELKGNPNQTPSPKPAEKEPRLSSKEMQTRVEATEDQLGETLDELARRLDPHYINDRVKRRIGEKPLHAGFLAAGAGLLSGVLIRRRFRRA